jgi:uncharacterized protein
VLPLFGALITTHAVRLPVDDGAIAVPHQTIHIQSASGGSLAAWYVPSRNGATVLDVHGAGSDRSRVADQAEILARHRFGVLSLDLPGHGESDGHAHLLGANAQRALRTAMHWLTRRAEVGPNRMGGFGMSLGGEVLLEAASRDSGSGLSAPTAPSAPPPLLGMLAGITPRRVLLIAAGARPNEIRVNRAYRDAAGATTELWTLPEAGHTGGIRARPAEYERRVTTFLRDDLLQ